MSQLSSTNGETSELETEIRKLKLELLKEELDDKLFTFREYLEKKQRQKTMQHNLTSPNANQSVTTQDLTEKPFSSILFAPVVGDFEVWHFVFLILFSWIFLMFLTNYIRKRIIYYKLRNKRKNSLRIKKKNTFKRLKEIEYKSENLFKVTQLDNEYENIDLTNSKETQPAYVDIKQEESEQDKPFELDPSVLPSRRDFFLYTIAEHEMLTKKTFSYKKKPKNPTAMLAKLSRSDPNLSIKSV